MGGKGSGRPTKEQQLIRSMNPKPEQRTPMASTGTADLFIPNHSGDHSAGQVLTTPTGDYDIVNKKYVDDSQITDYWKTFGAQTGLTGDKTGTFDLTTTGTIQANTFRDGTMILTNDQATDLLRFFNSSNSDSVALFGTDGGISVRTTDSNIRAGYFDDGTAIAKIANTQDSGEYFKFYLSASESTDYVRFLYGTGLEVRNDTNSSALNVIGDSILQGDLTIGDGTNDAVLTFDSTNNGIITWDSSDNEFEFGDSIRFTGTDDSFGRAIKGGISYNLSTASNSQIFTEIQANTTGTGGVGTLTGGNFQTRHFGSSGTQTGSLRGGEFSVYLSGSNNTTATAGYFWVGINQDNNATTNTAGSFRLFGYNTKTSSVSTMRNLYVWGDAEDLTVTNWYGAYFDEIAKDTGTVTNMYGIYLKEQTAGNTNYQIYSTGGDNYFGDGTHNFVGTTQMSVGNNDYITFRTGGGDKVEMVFSENALSTEVIGLQYDGSGSGDANSLKVRRFLATAKDCAEFTAGGNLILPNDNAKLALGASGTTDSYIQFDGTDLELYTTGVLKFGTHSAIGAETVTGYITIKDSGGTTRKLAVVS